MPRRPEDQPRIRDVPAPRRTKSAIGPLLRWAFAWPYRMALVGLARTPLHAWHLTLLSLANNIVVGWLLVTGERFLPGMLLVTAGMLDILDGGLARLRGEDSKAGAFLDSVVDRVSDLVVFACIFWSETSQGRDVSAGLALAALVASFLVSHIRAEGEAVGLTLTEGMVQRLERYVALIFGLIVPGALPYVLGILTGLGVITALQRAASAWTQLGRKDRPAGEKKE
jgi:CDP-diacylglycerol--glycerol-3-phosphate 3-phosphatidyltransferase